MNSKIYAIAVCLFINPNERQQRAPFEHSQLSKVNDIRFDKCVRAIRLVIYFYTLKTRRSHLRACIYVFHIVRHTITIKYYYYNVSIAIILFFSFFFN